jgi:two-component system sensor histidine kinase ChvG
MARQEAGTRASRLRRWFRLARQLAARIGVRLLAFNVLLAFVPMGGVLYLVTYERHLRDAQERGMIQQGRVLAAVLADEVPLDRARVALALQRLDRRIDSRLRIVDRTGQLLGDSSAGTPETQAGAAPASGLGRYASSDRYPSGDDGPESVAPSTRSRVLYRVGLLIVRIKRTLFTPRQPFGIRPESGDAPAMAERSEVKAALAGRYGATTRLTGGQRSVTFYSAIPIRRGDEVVGAVVVSQSTYRLLQALYDVRLEAFQVIVGSVLGAIALSAMLAATIARPLAQLRAEAGARLDRRRRGGPVPDEPFAASRRLDEIGDLARALETMTDRLGSHVTFVESFAADVSHELKNPIAAIRTVAETLATVDDPATRARFMAMLTRDVERLDRLVSGLREIVSVDAQLDREPAVAVEIAPLLMNIAEAHRLARAAPGVVVRVDNRAAGPVRVMAAPDRLVQVFGNLVDNAVSFSPPGAVVTLMLSRDRGDVVVTVIDDGAGIPEAHLPRIFDRFFSYRPYALVPYVGAAHVGAADAGAASTSDSPSPGVRHTGLGLAIAKAIVEGYSGSISASNEPGRGARFDVRLPLVS